jgi:hypothetical protein
MPKYMPQYSLSPVVFVSDDVRAEGMGFLYGEKGMATQHKKSDEAILDVTWAEVRKVSIVRNKRTLGIVHFLLIVCLFQGIFSAIFLPHIVFHIFFDSTIMWAGFVEIELKSGQIVRLTPAGWTRLGFHIRESELTYKRVVAYTKLPDIEILEYKDYDNV